MTSHPSVDPAVDDRRGAELLRFLFSRRRVVTRAVLGAMLATLAVAVVSSRTWTARGSFVAQAGGMENLGALAGLASQFGVNLGSAAGGYPPRFYSALVTSDEVLGVVVDQPAPATDGSPTMTVGEALGAKGATPEIRRARAIDRARRNVVAALFDGRTGLTGFSVRTKDARLSAQIAGAIVQEMNRFNSERHRSRASTERRFVEARRAVVADELRQAEESVQSFLVRNRAYDSSPERQLEYDRLTRRKSQLSTVLTSLTQSFEQARIEEVRDTPVLTVVETPVIPVLPDRRPVAQWAVGAALLAALVSLSGLVAIHLLGLSAAPVGEGPSTPSEMARQLAGDLRRPWRLFL